ncbi:MAG: NADPH-dependent F420 reductase [Chloroflexota bacterium]
MKKIGILGSGIVGTTLASGFLKYGYEVMIGSRHPKKLEEWHKQNEKGQIGDFAQTAAFGDIIVFGVKGAGAENALNEAGIENFSGKTVLDATNPISEDNPPQNGVLKYFTTFDESLMERLQKLAPQANFVKAFNSVGAALMVDPDLPGGKPSMFVCGDNDGAKSEAAEILTQFGWEVEDVGKANAAGPIESLCMLWCIPGFLRNDWTHAFKLLKK